MIYTVEVFNIVNEAEVDVFSGISLLSPSSSECWQLISACFAFSKPRLYFWKFLVHVLLKPALKDFEHNLTSMQNEQNCTVVCTFFGIPFFRIEMKTELFHSHPFLFTDS